MDILDYLEAMQRQQAMLDLQRQAQIKEQQMILDAQRQQGGRGSLPSPPTGLMRYFGGGGGAGFEPAGAGNIGGIGTSGGGTSAGGLGAAGIGGIIAAAIALQHGLSNATDTKFEGVRTDDAFAGHFGTEPWLAFLHDKLGLGPTAGEKFDAAMANQDYGLALRRAPAMLNYWADPPSSWAEVPTRAVLGDKWGKWANPVGTLLDMLGG